MFAIPAIPAVSIGLWLVWNVFRIRKFFANMNATQFIETSSMLVHAACFVSYLVAQIVYCYTY
jgi:hypothetical protein